MSWWRNLFGAGERPEETIPSSSAVASSLTPRLISWVSTAANPRSSPLRPTFPCP